MAPTNARKQMTRFSTFILAVVMISGGVSFAFAQQAQPRYVVSPFAPFFNFGNRSSGPIPRTVVDFQSSYAPGTIFIDTTERRLYLVTGRSQAIRYGIGVGRDGYGSAGALSVISKREWPNWFPPVDMLARRPDPHFRWRKPVGPFPLRTDAESACPTVPIAAHADAVTNSLASAGHEIEPPFCCVDENGSWRVAALKIDHGARNWPRTAVAEIKEGSERTDDVSWLGLLGKGKADPA